MSPQQQQMLTPSLSATSDLAAQFALLRDLIPTVQQLADLRKAIDQECLAHTEDCPTRNPALSSGTVVEIALYLSSSLVQWQGTASDVSWDVQLRALVAALALLLHQGARNLTAEPHESLRRNIAARFNDIVNFSTSSLEDRMSKVNAFYLIRLINQYFSLFKRAQPLSDALPLPVIGLVMAGASMAGGQYNGLRSIFQYADEVIGLIPGRKNRYLNLPAIQEITRRATTMMDVTSRAQNHIHAPEIAADATSDVNLVQELLDTHFQDIPSKRSDQWNWPLARLRLGPPLMNKWGFFYGLLDCAAQLARYHGPEQLSPTLLRNLEQLLAESEFEEFRWKVREITTSFNEQSTSPSALAEAQWASEKTSSGTTSAPSLGVGLSPATTVDPDVIQPCTQEGDSMTGHSVNEADPVRFMEGNLGHWEQDGEAAFHHLLPPSKLLQRTSHRAFSHAGLSSDCRLSFFHKPTVVCVYPTLGHGQGGPTKEPIFERRFHGGDEVLEASLSKSLLAVSTPRRLLLFGIGARFSSNAQAEILHGDWDPTSVALHEEPSNSLVAVGHRRRTKGQREGQVVLYDVMVSPDGCIRVDLAQVYQLPMQDQPKTLLFHGDGETLICITSIRNSVLVWKPSESAPVVITRHKHTQETDSEGVTSAVLYQSPNKQVYVCCATSASTERYRSKGEWPFTAPVAACSEEVPPSSIHDLVALQSHRQLVASAVSGEANIYAVLEKTGRIITLRLSSHEEGGICACDEPPQKLRGSLCGSRSPRASTTCMKFDPSGRRLYAVDPEGTLVVVTFKPEG